MGPSELATEQGEFVAEHDDLELLELIRAETQRRELQEAPKHEVGKRPERHRLLKRTGTGARLYDHDRSTDVEPS